MKSEYVPLVRDLFRAVADNEPRAEITVLQQHVQKESAAVVKRMDMAYAWFDKYGGWGGTDPDPLPEQWQERTEKFQQWTWDYQVLQCCKFLTTALLLELERE